MSRKKEIGPPIPKPLGHTSDMQIKWRNIFAFLLALGAFILLIHSLEPIAAFLATMRDIGPGHTPEEQLKGLLAFGLVLISILGVIRILARSDGDS